MLWGIKTTTNFENLKLDEVDWIIVAINTGNVPGLVSSLFALGLTDKLLFLDTPVLHLSDLKCLHTINKFRRVLTTEESIVLPNYMIAKEILASGDIGELKRIWFFNNGFKYHALATIKSLLDEKYILKGTFLRYGENCIETTLNFNGGIKASIIEPRDYESGRFLIAGSQGLITDYRINSDMTDCKIFRIGYRITKDKIIGFTVNGVARIPTELDELFFQKLDMSKIPQPTITHQIKIRGLVEYFHLISSGDDSSFGYDYREGIYDSIFFHISNKFSRWYDFPVHFRCSLIPIIIRLLSLRN